MSYTSIHPFANLSPTFPCPSYKRRGEKEKILYIGEGALILLLLPLSPGAELSAGR